MTPAQARPPMAGMNTEEQILELVRTTSRIEQRLEDHISAEDGRWEELMGRVEKRADRRIGWWQTAIVALASSGLFVGAVELFFRRK